MRLPGDFTTEHTESTHLPGVQVPGENTELFKTFSVNSVFSVVKRMFVLIFWYNFRP